MPIVGLGTQRVETAMTKAIPTPSDSNLTAVVTALETVMTNAKDSPAISASDAKGRIAGSIAGIARDFRREVLHVRNKGGAGAEKIKQLKLIQRRFSQPLGGWSSHKTAATTD
jgi:hypothetical protein